MSWLRHKSCIPPLYWGWGFLCQWQHCLQAWIDSYRATSWDTVVMFSEEVTGRKCLALYVLSHLSNRVYLGRITYMCSNCLYKTRLFVVQPLVGKQSLIKKTTFCGLLKWISKLQPVFHCSEIWVWKMERFLNWWWNTSGCMFKCSAELFRSGK